MFGGRRRTHGPSVGHWSWVGISTPGTDRILEAVVKVSRRRVHHCGSRNPPGTWSLGSEDTFRHFLWVESTDPRTRVQTLPLTTR